MLQQKLPLLIFLGILLIALGQEEKTCDAKDATCNAESDLPETLSKKTHKTRAVRFFSDTSYCSSSSNKDLYSNGGSAQAYLKSSAISSTVCHKRVAEDHSYKVSSWPFTRHTQGTAPSMDFTFHLWSCRPKDEAVSACACSPLAVGDGTTNNAFVEIWQTLPNGYYSSLRDSEQSICRATVPVNEQGDATFTTVAPGSSGIFSGLGPFDAPPYGPPVIHVLVKVPHHDSLLLDLPVLPHPKTLEERNFSFSGFDWRGLAWSKQLKEALPYKIVSWDSDVERNHVDIEVNIFLQLAAGEEEAKRSSTSEFCSSWYFLPASLFLQPIAICGKYLLDFFPL
jgi:hypothetical protein